MIDPHSSCKKELADLYKRLHKRLEISRVLVEEGDQNGLWLRVARIKLIRQTPEGTEITVS